MARVAWQFAGYSWPVNPTEDSGWDKEHIIAESNPIGSRKSSFQHGGTKSARRQVSGYIIGIHGSEQLVKMASWRDNLTESTLVDHIGGSRRARLVKFVAKPVTDVTEWKHGRQTYHYDAEFVSMD